MKGIVVMARVRVFSYKLLTNVVIVHEPVTSDEGDPWKAEFEIASPHNNERGSLLTMPMEK